MLSEKMSPWQLYIVKEEPGKLPLKFGQNGMINSMVMGGGGGWWLLVAAMGGGVE